MPLTNFGHTEAMFGLLTLLALAVGQVAPPLNIHSAQGAVSRLKPAARGLTLLNFWATWCPPCREELPRLQAGQRPGRLRVVAINVGQSAPGVLNFWKENQLGHLPLVFARSAELQGWPLPGLPTSVLLDPDGTVRALKFGPVTAEELAAWAKAKY